MQDTSTVLTVRDVLIRVRQRPVAAAAPVVLGLLLAVAYVVLTPPAFSATASVKVEPVVADRYAGNINVSNLISMETEMQVARSTEVAALAAETLGVDQHTVRAAVVVDSPQDTQVMNISYTAASPRTAAQGAETVATSYLTYRKTSAQAVARAQVKQVEQDIAAVEKRIAARSTTALQAQLETLNASKRALDLLLANNAGEVINRPVEPESPSSPRPAVAVAAGVGLGVLLGLGLAVLRPVRSRRRTATAPVPPRLQRAGVPRARSAVPGVPVVPATPSAVPGLPSTTPGQSVTPTPTTPTAPPAPGARASARPAPAPARRS